MTSPRVIVDGATTAITGRTTLRKAFLGPWDPLVQQCWIYALADAQRHTGVAFHHGALVVNHEHLTVTPSEDNLPEFVRRLHRDYDAPRELFDKRAPHCQRLCDHAAEAIRLIGQVRPASFMSRVVHGTPGKDSAHPHAIVSQPGTLLCDVECAYAGPISHPCLSPRFQQRFGEFPLPARPSSIAAIRWRGLGSDARKPLRFVRPLRAQQQQPGARHDRE